MKVFSWNTRKKKQATIVYHSKYLPLWYVMSSIGSNVNSLEMANSFYESGLFSAAEPDMWSESDLFCVNDPYFSSQWNLSNTDLYGTEYTGIDVNFCSARSMIPDSSNVVIAVLDQGVQLNHPDLAANIKGSGYDTETHSSPSVVYGNHGTACAGIISAILNNNLCVAGLAANCKIMSISNTLVGNYASRYNRAEGIAYAAYHQASVISNSWGSSECLTVIDDAIEFALQHGRYGKGCIVVFAAGNDNSIVSYPANSNQDIIVVGAMSPCGERKNPLSCDGENWGSNFGYELDVMAPGVLIPTTDRTGIDGYTNQDYYLFFNGTSSACPHVAAIAGLVLSVNPDLTQKEVADIIESTAQKVGGYSYNITSNRPNGKWCLDMGYGLVDASAAVQKALDMNIEGPTVLTDSSWYYIRNVPSGATITWNITNNCQNPKYTLVSPQGRDSMYVANRSTPLNPWNPLTLGESISVEGFNPPQIYHKGTLSVTVSYGTKTYTAKKTIREPSGSSLMIPQLIGSTDETMLNIHIQEGEGLFENGQTATLSLIHPIYGRMRMQRAIDTNSQMSISDLPKGVYILLLQQNGKPIAETKVMVP